MRALLTLRAAAVCAAAQEWPYYGGMRAAPNTPRSSRFTAATSGGSKWPGPTAPGDGSDGVRYPVRSAFECTPLVIEGVTYLTTPFCRLIALEAETGRELWNFDPAIDRSKPHNLFVITSGITICPAQPNLLTVRRGGLDIPAVTQVTKTGFAFVFHRVTGEPLFPVEERAVPPRDVPGEQAWPTQPFPLKPPPFARQSVRPDELTDVTPDSRAFCAKLMEGAVLGGFYTPIGLRPTILFPGTNGGVAAPLTMKACMDCHAAKRATLACNACHELGQ